MPSRLTEIRRKAQLTLMFTAVVFLIMTVSMLLVYLIMLILPRVLPGTAIDAARLPLLPPFILCSIISGTLITILTSRLPLKPLRELLAATDRIAAGDYSVRLTPKGPQEFRELREGFNHMAQELGSVEILRSDFVNNFSHEFKTPIVSIRGFANILLSEDLSEEERREYLEIIVQESERLSELSANVLNLSRIEQQSILTDRNRFNVSEQIRRVIALMDSRWADKDIAWRFDCGETEITGNEELLQQVWMNLLDNAAKFSPQGGTVEVEIRQDGGRLAVSVVNEGTPLSPEVKRHVFDKFYQGDTSRTTKGNGLGLTLVKTIAELHRGQVTVGERDGKRIVFTVDLPQDS